MPIVNLKTGVRIHYRDCGDGVPLLFIPGLAATADSWNYQVLGLHRQYRCVCVDLRGHGESEKPCSNYSYDEMCGDVHALLLELDLRKVTLVGWSMGAGIALKYVSDFNEEGRVTKLAMLAPATPRFPGDRNRTVRRGSRSSQNDTGGATRRAAGNHGRFRGGEFSSRRLASNRELVSFAVAEDARPMSLTSASVRCSPKICETGWSTSTCPR